VGSLLYCKYAAESVCKIISKIGQYLMKFLGNFMAYLHMDFDRGPGMVQ